MTTIDQRILVPAPPQVVWDFISDIRNNPRWQTGCSNVVFLTSKVTGPGTRWRQSMDKSSEQVIEISAWYEGLGYQYTYIDGVPFRESTGRIRLQEIPEGTVVQWTITYQMGGLLGGMRSSLGLNKRLESMMVTSLKSLWKQVNETSSAQRDHEAKSLIREAPDAEARANYKPRHTPVVDIRAESDGDAPPSETPVAEPVASDSDDARFRPPEGHIIPEPAIAEDDTRPRRPVETPPPAEPTARRKTIPELVETSEEPEFLEDLSRFAPPPPQDDTQPIHAETASPPAAPEPDFMAQFTLNDSDFASPATSDAAQETADASLTDEINKITYQPESWDEPEDEPIAGISTSDTPAAPADESDKQTEPSLRPVEAETEAERDSLEPEQVTTSTLNGKEHAESETPTAQSPRIDEGAFEPPAGTDTSKLSIWEIFGVPRPSGTSEVAATHVDAPAETAPSEEKPEASAEAVTEPRAIEEPADDLPDMKLDTGELVIVEVVREVSGPKRRTGLRKRLRRQRHRLRRPQ